MLILITNDDGISSKGLLALALAAQRRGHDVLISAPSAEQSAAGQRITLSTPLFVHQTTFEEGFRAFAVEGSPADCVRVAPELADRPIDFCISGINNGENAGCAVYYSGTVSAAREAAMQYIPSLAVSIMAGADKAMLDHLADIAVRTAEAILPLKERLPRLSVVNLNAPALPRSQLLPMTVCPLSTAYYTDSYEKRVSPFGKIYFWLNKDLTMETPEEGSDYDLLKKGHLTLTLIAPLQDNHLACADILQDILQSSCGNN